MRIDLREESGGSILELEDLEVGGIENLKGERMREGIREVREFITLIEGELTGLGDGGVDGCECGDSGGAEGL